MEPESTMASRNDQHLAGGPVETCTRNSVAACRTRNNISRCSIGTPCRLSPLSLHTPWPARGVASGFANPARGSDGRVSETHAPVNFPDLSVDPCGVIRKQECHDGGDIGRLAQTRAAHVLQGLGEPYRIVVPQLLLAQNQARRHGIATYTLFPPPRCDVAGDHFDAGLGGCAVVGTVGHYTGRGAG